MAEIQAVARELSVAPTFVEAAIGKLQERRAAEAAERERAARAAAERARSRRVLGARIAAVFVVIAVICGLCVGLPALSGARALEASKGALDLTAANLSVALDRQVSLAPTLVAFAGGDASVLAGARDATISASTLEDKLKASLALDSAMAQALAGLPSSTDPAVNKRQSEMQYEIIGSRNRIDTERQRWDAARRSYESAANTFGGRWAVRLGLSEK